MGLKVTNTCGPMNFFFLEKLKADFIKEDPQQMWNSKKWRGVLPHKSWDSQYHYLIPNSIPVPLIM